MSYKYITLKERPTKEGALISLGNRNYYKPFEEHNIPLYENISCPADFYYFPRWMNIVCGFLSARLCTINWGKDKIPKIVDGLALLYHDDALREKWSGIIALCYQCGNRYEEWDHHLGDHGTELLNDLKDKGYEL